MNINELPVQVIDEVRNTIIKSIEVTDTYFYATLLFYKSNSIESFTKKIHSRIILNLYNSKDFDTQYKSSQYKTVEAKRIEIDDELDLDTYNMTDNPEFIRQYFYDSLSRKLVSTLLNQNLEFFTNIKSNRYKVI